MRVTSRFSLPQLNEPRIFGDSLAGCLLRSGRKGSWTFHRSLLVSQLTHPVTSIEIMKSSSVYKLRRRSNARLCRLAVSEWSLEHSRPTVTNQTPTLSKPSQNTAKRITTVSLTLTLLTSGAAAVHTFSPDFQILTDEVASSATIVAFLFTALRD